MNNYKRSKEHRQKISLALTGIKRKSFSEEHRQKLSRAKIGHSTSEQTRQKLSKTNKGHLVSEETRQKIRKGNQDKVVLEETRQKISLANKGRKLSEVTKQRMSKSRSKSIALGLFHPGCYGQRGYFFSEKNNRSLYYESSYELLAFQILEQMSIVKNYRRCPFSVPYMTNDGCAHRYIPDVLVTYQSRKQQVIEVKPKYALDLWENPVKIEAAKKFCEDKGMSFRVWTEEELGSQMKSF